MKHSSTSLRIVLFVCISHFGIGCSGDGSTQPTDSIAAEPDTLAGIQANIFTPTCAVSGCHSGSTAPVGLMLDEGLAFANLVGVISGQDSDFQRVNPGRADDSYLVQKLEGTASGGVQMPFGQPPLSTELIQNVRDWITAGALSGQANGSPELIATLSELQTGLFTPTCIECHGGNFPAAGMSLETGQSFSNLVNVMAASSSNTRVIPGNASNSFIVRKLLGADLMPDEGGRMPLGGQMVSQPLIDQLAAWIEAGAMNN